MISMQRESLATTREFRPDDPIDMVVVDTNDGDRPSDKTVISSPRGSGFCTECVAEIRLRD